MESSPFPNQHACSAQLRALQFHTPMANRLNMKQEPNIPSNVPQGISDLITQLPKQEDGIQDNRDQDGETEFAMDGSTFPYKCDFCGRGFNNNKQYEEHLKTHSVKLEEKPTQLQIQPGDKAQELYPQQETRSQHSQGYQCQVCGKQFNQRYHLQTHMASHTGNKPYSCMICGKAFARKDVLGVHMKVHSDVKEFQCEVCGARFKQRYHLTRHMNTHLERVDVVCDFCGQVFHRLDRYNQHIKRVHITKDPQ